MSESYRGKCPICSAQLLDEGGILTCTKVPGHFQIKQAIFEAAWDKFDAETMSAANLLKILGDANTAPDRPAPEWWKVGNEPKK